MKQAIRLFTTLTLILMLVLLSAAPAFAEDESGEGRDYLYSEDGGVLCETFEEYTYALFDDGTIEIHEYSGTQTDLVIPSELNGQIVSGVRLANDTMTSCTIPDHVTGYFTISSPVLTAIYVSDNNPAYKSVDGVLYSKDGTELYQYPVGRTETTFTVPDGVKVIMGSAFSSNKALTEVVLPDGIEEINEYAFHWCENLAKINLPEGLKFIGHWSFLHCALTEVTIPASVKILHPGAFGGSSTLEKITVLSKDVISAEDAPLMDWLGGEITHPNFTVYGYADSTVEAWSTTIFNSGYPFVVISEETDTSEPGESKADVNETNSAENVQNTSTAPQKNPNTNPTTITTNPKTADNSAIVLCVVLLLVSGLTLTIASKKA